MQSRPLRLEPESPDRPAGRPIPTDRAAQLFQSEVALLTGLSERTLEAMRTRPGDETIPFTKIGRAVRYPRGAVDDFVMARLRLSTRA